MIPDFPQFKNIEWSDSVEVRQITKAFPPYSDFNFTSMYSWDTREKMRLSKLNCNLVVLFYDYITQMPFLSFIGDNDICDTASRLIEYSKRHFHANHLKLIPEAIATKLRPSSFVVSPDRDDYDYILSVPFLESIDRLSKEKYDASRYCKYFYNLYPDFKVINSQASDIRNEEYIALYKTWARLKNLDHWELNEYSAFERYLNNKCENNSVVAMYYEQVLVGFQLYEILNDEYAIIHFAKANNYFRGINFALLHEVGKVLFKQGIAYLNYEQDMGLPGLRQAKCKFKPSFYLHKYVVEMK